MKIWKHVTAGVFLLFLVWVPTKNYWHAGFPYTHDGENHLARFANYYLAVKEGQVPPRFAPNLMNHYGYPVFNYNYPLANILSVPLRIVDLPYEWIFKIQVLIATGLGVLGVWQWLKQYGAPTAAQRVAAWSYVTAPYLLNIATYRGNIGEWWAWSLLPWLGVSVEWWRSAAADRRQTGQRWLATIVIWMAFLLAHNIMVLMVGMILAGYVGWRLVGQRRWWGWLSAVAAAVGLSWWFWWPAWAEKTLVVLDQAGLSQGYADHFVTWPQLLTSPLRFGFSYLGSIDTLGFTLGWWPWLVAGLSGLAVVLIWRRHTLPQWLPNQTQLVVWWLGVWLVSVWLQLAVSQPAWASLGVLRFVQFPWRWGLISTMASTLLSGIGWPQWTTTAKRLVVLVLLVQTGWALTIRPVDYFHRTNVDYEAFSQSTTTSQENLPKAWHYQQIADWQPTPMLLQGTGEVAVAVWRGSVRQYQVRISEPSIVVEPTMAFAGWQTWLTPQAGGTAQRVEYIDNEVIAGRLAFMVPVGEYQVRSVFTQQTLARQIGNGVSLGTVGLVAVGAGWYLWPRKRHPRK